MVVVAAVAWALLFVAEIDFGGPREPKQGGGNKIMGMRSVLHLVKLY